MVPSESHGVRWARDEDDSLAIVTLNGDCGGVPGGLGEACDWIERERESLSGVVLCSSGPVFRRDADPSAVLSASLADAASLTAEIGAEAALLRRLESCGLPVVALIAGDAIGDGFGLALAAHRRIAVGADDIELGLPQVRLGLLPGRGALTRAVRLLGISEALTGLLAQGQLLGPARALKLGLVDELVDEPEDLLPAARRWIAGEPESRQPWDRDEYRMPGGTPSSPQLARLLPTFPAYLRKRLKGANYPAPRAITAAAVEGAQLAFDNAVAVETRYLVHLSCGQVARNMVQAFHVDLKRIVASAERAGKDEEFRPRRVAVLGAGMMGAAIAYVAAAAGSEVVLRDVTIEAAERGKGYAETVVRRAVERGRSNAADGRALLARITPTAAIEAAGGSDLVIEAVFEDAQLKASVLSEIAALQAPGSLIASNTSTLPISDLAENVSRPEEFVGLHFFSPAERMPLLEIIAGRQTSPQALARALAVARLFGKTPIIVNDSRGFFTSRVITMFLDEALTMLAEGIPAASVEQASLQAGYPAAALQLCDELSLELMRRIGNQYKAAATAEGLAWETVPAERVIDEMIDAHARPGRAAGAGFYEYVDGKRTRLWPGLRALAAPLDPLAPLRELEERMLFIESIESVKCRDEGVIATVAEANVGSILGIGFPPWTGGVLQYISGYEGGPAGFVARARELAGAYGPRFEPPSSLVELAAGGGRLTDPC